MNKYLEALERLAMPDDIHIKECEKLGIGLTEDYDTVEKALLELKSIKEANISEALECLEKLKGMEISSMPFSDEYGTQEVDLNDIRKVGSQLNTDFREYTTTIKQALLKAQEPKQYLKFEDLKFTYDEQKIKVRLNGENYTVVYFKVQTYDNHNGYEYVGVLKDDDIVVYSINGRLNTTYLLKQFFNNLHLEVVENE